MIKRNTFQKRGEKNQSEKGMKNSHVKLFHRFLQETLDKKHFIRNHFCSLLIGDIGSDQIPPKSLRHI